MILAVVEMDFDSQMCYNAVVNSACLAIRKEDVLKPNKQTNRDKTIALYLRISREDKTGDESNSIVNQKSC